MRIDLIAPPYSGHLHPILAIARQLAAQHDVRVLSTPAAMARIAACGLHGISVLDAQADQLLAQIANPPHGRPQSVAAAPPIARSIGPDGAAG